MPAVWFAVVLAVSGVAAWRAAGPLTSSIAIRTEVAAVFEVSFAVLTSLIFGVFKLGGNGLALGLAALIASAIVLALVPRQGPTILDWWGSLPSWGRAVVGGVAGLAAMTIVWHTRNPLLGFDGVDYHLPESLHYVQHGNPGAAFPISIINPYGAFPLVDEIFNGWMLALARGFGPVMAWPVIATVLLGLGSYSAIRSRKVGATAAALAAVAVASGPMIIGSFLGPGSDIASLAWLAIAAALLWSSAESPLLAGPGLLAVGLAIGTKTTVLPFCAALVIVWLWRRPWAGLAGRRALFACMAAGGALQGGLFYVRNFVTHGSPVWPTTIVPWGDPRPPGFFGLYATFLGHPRTTLQGNLGLYRGYLSGHLLLIALGVAVVVLSRSRLAQAFGLATIVGVLLYLTAPGTGIPAGSPIVLALIHVVSIRYVLPTALTAAAAIAFAAAGSKGRITQAWCAALVIATLWNIQFDLTSPSVGHAGVGLLVLAIAAGAAAGGLASGTLPRRLLPAGSRRTLLAGGAALVVAIGGLAAYTRVGSAHFLERHARFRQPDSALINAVVAQEPLLGTRTVAMSPTADALASGDKLRRRVEFIAPGEPCVSVRKRLSTQTVIITPSFGTDQLEGLRQEISQCLTGIAPTFSVGGYDVYSNAR